MATMRISDVHRRLARMPEISDRFSLLLDAAVEYHRGNVAEGDRLASEFDRSIPALLRLLEDQAAENDADAMEALRWFREIYPKQMN